MGARWGSGGGSGGGRALRGGRFAWEEPEGGGGRFPELMSLVGLGVGSEKGGG